MERLWTGLQVRRRCLGDLARRSEAKAGQATAMSRSPGEKSQEPGVAFQPMPWVELWKPPPVTNHERESFPSPATLLEKLG